MSFRVYVYQPDYYGMPPFYECQKIHGIGQSHAGMFLELSDSNNKPVMYINKQSVLRIEVISED